ncbi:hypothetical protein Emed_003179 [Eimeria media]
MGMLRVTFSRKKAIGKFNQLTPHWRPKRILLSAGQATYVLLLQRLPLVTLRLLSWQQLEQHGINRRASPSLRPRFTIGHLADGCCSSAAFGQGLFGRGDICFSVNSSSLFRCTSNEKRTSSHTAAACGLSQVTGCSEPACAPLLRCCNQRRPLRCCQSSSASPQHQQQQLREQHQQQFVLQEQRRREQGLLAQQQQLLQNKQHDASQLLQQRVLKQQQEERVRLQQQGVEQAFLQQQETHCLLLQQERHRKLPQDAYVSKRAPRDSSRLPPRPTLHYQQQVRHSELGQWEKHQRQLPQHVQQLQHVQREPHVQQQQEQQQRVLHQYRTASAAPATNAAATATATPTTATTAATAAATALTATTGMARPAAGSTLKATPIGAAAQTLAAAQRYRLKRLTAEAPQQQQQLQQPQQHQLPQQQHHSGKWSTEWLHSSTLRQHCASNAASATASAPTGATAAAPWTAQQRLQQHVSVCVLPPLAELSAHPLVEAPVNLSPILTSRRNGVLQQQQHQLLQRQLRSQQQRKSTDTATLSAVTLLQHQQQRQQDQPQQSNARDPIERRLQQQPPGRVVEVVRPLLRNSIVSPPKRRGTLTAAAAPDLNCLFKCCCSELSAKPFGHQWNLKRPLGRCSSKSLGGARNLEELLAAAAGRVPAAAGSVGAKQREQDQQRQEERKMQLDLQKEHDRQIQERQLLSPDEANALVWTTIGRLRRLAAACATGRVRIEETRLLKVDVRSDCHLLGRCFVRCCCFGCRCCCRSFFLPLCNGRTLSLLRFPRHTLSQAEQLLQQVPSGALGFTERAAAAGLHCCRCRCCWTRRLHVRKSGGGLRPLATTADLKAAEATAAPPEKRKAEVEQPQQQQKGGEKAASCSICCSGGTAAVARTAVAAPTIADARTARVCGNSWALTMRSSSSSNSSHSSRDHLLPPAAALELRDGPAAFAAAEQQHLHVQGQQDTSADAAHAGNPTAEAAAAEIAAAAEAAAAEAAALSEAVAAAAAASALTSADPFQGSAGAAEPSEDGEDTLLLQELRPLDSSVEASFPLQQQQQRELQQQQHQQNHRRSSDRGGVDATLVAGENHVSDAASMLQLLSELQNTDECSAAAAVVGELVGLVDGPAYFRLRGLPSPRALVKYSRRSFQPRVLGLSRVPPPLPPSGTPGQPLELGGLSNGPPTDSNGPAAKRGEDVSLVELLKAGQPASKRPCTPGR